ncbi:hypothetical protein PP7435_CHR1-0445 [Komagataella phaffii CBS 7435]|uniref:Uncharacterized protein n=2 Tax=Komagataella phaffii TaxID=460519 RepID=C4QW76_KOMPG|nr:Hypothetical protein PAS_chr1-1_0135 [Komagataella phaffii GS115]AOA60737.1 GQ67_02712T0 [Komagataella phaffii]CAH2446167.1 hypothetical protein BQ9382_C1-2305 [Komagataella phaffii CBS 7435]AOA66647.1 GQ68_02536T0 [Komagataella phaffii GS115]CAY67499.1 Hypothetical protein PAS_chr1-1_0135 [Komagataella phaffii GS115]CCA36598.1 hypothetical protein PP7435_CHR1-0445 [Komagataella phaffii CBS 7435]
MLTKFLIPVVASIAAVSAAPKASPFALAEAGAIPYEFAQALETPEVFKRAEDYNCHLNCGLMIYAAWDCGPEAGPFDADCLCSDGSAFNTRKDYCLECGWCLYQSYFGYLSGPLATCGYPTTPTGQTCIETATGLTPTIGPFTNGGGATSSSSSSSSAAPTSSSSASSSAAPSSSEVSSSAAPSSSEVSSSAAPSSSEVSSSASSVAPTSSAVSSSGSSVAPTVSSASTSHSSSVAPSVSPIAGGAAANGVGISAMFGAVMGYLFI